MKTEEKIIIELPIDKVMELFSNPDNFKHWQKGLISSTPITAVQGQEGSKRKMKIKTSVATIQMVEEITTHDLPHIWEATYRTKGVVNYQSNRFRESEKLINNQTIKVTHWHATTIFKFTGMMRLIAKAQSQVFLKQTASFMQDFKRFAEEGKSVSQS